MKKSFVYIALIIMASACTLIEPNEQGQTRITYQTLNGGITKAATAFDTDNVFYSYAYYLPSGQSWDAHKASSALYINQAKIKYISGGASSYWAAVNASNVETPQYWPIDGGSLTFFAWTDNTSAPSVSGSTVTCNTNGIQMNGFSVEDNPNKDILVAETAKDQTTNSSHVGPWDNGVPTVFKHTLCSFAFNIHVLASDASIEYRLNSIVFSNLYKSGNYNQSALLGWSDRQDMDNLSMFSSVAGQVITAEAQDVVVSSGDYYMLIPQMTTNMTLPAENQPSLILTYSVYSGGVFQTTKTRTATLNEIYGVSMFASGMKYVLSIGLGQQEVFWAPGVAQWAVDEKVWYQ